jgi:hypothetical protein
MGTLLRQGGRNQEWEMPSFIFQKTDKITIEFLCEISDNIKVHYKE